MHRDLRIVDRLAMPESGITAIFWDLGGVLLSNGWDSAQRDRVARRFSLPLEELEQRHQMLARPLETGRCSLDEYLEFVVFHTPRDFAPVEFRRAMEECSQPVPENLAVVDALAASGRYLLATLNNESRELNEYRIQSFGLRRRFTLFCTSSFVGAMKPEPEIFRTALDLTQRRPDEALFVDDREANVEAARRLGIRGLHYSAELGVRGLRAGLEAHGIVLD